VVERRIVKFAASAGK